MKQDISVCYELKTKIFNTKQGTLYVTYYHGTLSGFWIELNKYQNLKMECNETTTMAEFIESNRIFEFLLGLNLEYDPIRV